MRAWTRIERLTNNSLDLIEWSAELLRQSRRTGLMAERALRRRGRSSIA
jgi:hypothetical protein